MAQLKRKELLMDSDNVDSGFNEERVDSDTSSSLSDPVKSVGQPLVPRHGLNSNSFNSDTNSCQEPQLACDSGFSSYSTSSGSFSTEHASLELQKAPCPPTQPAVHVHTHFYQFYLYIAQTFPNHYEWSKENFRGTISRNAIEEAERVMWTPNPEDEDGDFEAMLAARDRDEKAVLFARFVAPDAKTLNTQNLDRQTVLHAAAELLDHRVVRSLMVSGADGAVTDLWGNTPLHIAAKLGRGEVVRALTTRISKTEVGQPRYKVPHRSLPQDNKDQMNNDGRAPIHLAAQGCHADACRALAEAKVDLDQRRLGDGYCAVHIAIDNGDFECLKTLFECGADVEVKNYRGETPQQLAYLCRRPAMVQLCEEFGASPNQLELAETEQVHWSSSEDSDMDTMDDDDDLTPGMQRLSF